MKNLLLIASCILSSFGASANEIAPQDFPNHYLECTHSFNEESGASYQRVDNSEFEFGGDSYFAYTNFINILPTSTMNAHVSFRYDFHRKSYHFIYATRTYINRNLFEVIENQYDFTGNQEFNFTHNSQKSNRIFSVTCLIRRK